jgi:hypothetical protein
MNHLDQGLLSYRTRDLQIHVARGQQHGERMPIRQVPIQQQTSVTNDLTTQNGRGSTEVNKVYVPPQQVAEVKASHKHILDRHWPGKQGRQIYVRVASRLAPRL